MSPEDKKQIEWVVSDFYDRVFSDLMIGFFFKGKDKQHLIDREIEFARNILGDLDISYQGRPMDKVHQPLKIFGGHFDRRLQILKESLSRSSLPSSLQKQWIDHSLKLRKHITFDSEGECGNLPES